MTREIANLLKLALPLILAQLAQNTLGFVDTLMVGRLGSGALAGIALGSTVFHFFLIIMTGVLLAVSPLVSQAHGASDQEAAARAVRQGLWLGLVLFVPTFVLLWNIEPLLLRLGQDAETSALSSRYLRAIAWGLLPALGTTALRGFLEGLAVTRPIMVFSFIGLGLNVVANNILMFGRFGAPALGLVGTGYASSLVYFSVFAMTAAYIAFHYGGYRIFSRLRVPDFGMFRELLKVGVPIGLTLGFEVSMFSAMTFFMGLLGAAQLAAHQIALQSASITFMVPLGLSIATSVRVGQAAGRGDLRVARRAGYAGMVSSLFFMVLSALMFWFLPRFVTGLYLDVSDPANAEVISLAAAFLAIAAMFQLFDGLQVSASGALRGLKDTRVPMLITLFAYWFVGIGSGAFLGFAARLGGRGLWLGLVIGLAVAAVLLAWRFFSHMRALEQPRPGLRVPTDKCP